MLLFVHIYGSVQDLDQFTVEAEMPEIACRALENRAGALFDFIAAQPVSRAGYNTHVMPLNEGCTD